MDPHLNPPPLFPQLTVAPPFAAVNPTPTPPPTLPTVQNHPPYTEMITTAISALNEPDGSSKRAIAKYMETHFPGLPSNNSDIMIQHIKQMKATGHIVMVKNSYKLHVPGSAPVIASNAPVAASNAPVAASNAPVAASNGVVSSDSASAGTTKRRGRPPKVKPEFPQAAVAVPVFENSMNVNATPVFVPVDVGTVNGAVTTPSGSGSGRGRPPKSSGAKQGPGRPAKSGGSGRGRGRPKKAVVVAAEGGSVDSPKGSGKPRGRPKRSVQVNEGVVPPVGGAGTVVAPVVDVGGALPEKVVATEAGSVDTPKGSGRGRGRPRKAVQVNEGVTSPVGGAGTIVVPPVDGSSAVARSVGRPKGSGRGRGRPRKLVRGNDGVASPVGGVGTELALPVVLGKRRGRPPRAFSEVKKVKAQPTPRKSSGRSVGRPRKNASSTTTQSPGSGSQLLMAYLDLKGKLDNLQSGIKQAAIVIKPCLNNEGALNALRQLELLAAGDVNQQSPVQPPQLLPVQPPQQIPVQPPQQLPVQPPQQPLVQPPQQFVVQTPVTEPPQPVMPQFLI